MEHYKYILDNIVNKYFGHYAGAFWIFFNSDVMVDLSPDTPLLCFIETGEPLDAGESITFVVTDYDHWEKRIKNPQFTQEEVDNLLPVCDAAPEYVWPVLMWCASPVAAPWREKINKIYEAAHYCGSVLYYNRNLIPTDELETIGSLGGPCELCWEERPCVDYSDVFEAGCCRYCELQQYSDLMCPESDTCYYYPCKVNKNRDSPVKLTGLRFFVKD
jgi:hypothetical protein